jgi:hypothetical protein
MRSVLEPAGSAALRWISRPLGREQVTWFCWIMAGGLIGRQVGQLLLPYVVGGDTPSTLREDDYWSYSSGFVRRALLGEVLYRGTLWTGHNVSWVVSSLLVLVYGVVVWQVLRRIVEQHPLGEVLLLAATPLMIPFGVDREVLLLAPIVILAAAQKPAVGQVAASLVALVVNLVHEFAAILYVPVFLAMHMRTGRAARASLPLVAALLLTIETLPLVLWRPEPTLELEKLFWPRFGLAGLELTHLYRFANMRLSELLEMHARYATSGPAAIVNGGFALLFAWFLWSEVVRDALARVAFLGSLVPMFLLTIDYGRYAYLVFAFWLLAQECMENAKCIDTGALERVPGYSKWSRCSLLISALAPVGYWVSVLDRPTLARMANELEVSSRSV